MKQFKTYNDLTTWINNLKNKWLDATEITDIFYRAAFLQIDFSKQIVLVLEAEGYDLDNLTADGSEYDFGGAR